MLYVEKLTKINNKKTNTMKTKLFLIAILMFTIMTSFAQGNLQQEVQKRKSKMQQLKNTTVTNDSLSIQIVRHDTSKIFFQLYPLPRDLEKFYSVAIMWGEGARMEIDFTECNKKEYALVVNKKGKCFYNRTDVPLNEWTMNIMSNDEKEKFNSIVMYVMTLVDQLEWA